jgi:hypothetical protein
VLEIDLGRFNAVRARRPKRLPVVLAAAATASLALQGERRTDGFDRASSIETTISSN